MCNVHLPSIFAYIKKRVLCTKLCELFEIITIEISMRIIYGRYNYASLSCMAKPLKQIIYNCTKQRQKSITF